MSENLRISPAPHISRKHSTKTIMLDVLIGLAPASAAAVYHFRQHAVILILTCILASAAVEYICCKLMKRENSLGDLSAVVTGLILALSLPPKLPVIYAVIGSIFAVGVCKMAFGGLGCNIFNPAMGARAFLTVSFGMAMASWQLPAQMNPDIPDLGPQTEITAQKGSSEKEEDVKIDAVTQATPLSWVKQAVKTRNAEKASEIISSNWPNSQLKYALTGNIGGSLGETNALALLAGGIYLLIRRTITWHIPAAVLGSAFIFAEIGYLIDKSAFANPLVHMVSGGMLICAFFIATDPVSSPITRAGTVVFGCGVGLIIVLIRLFGTYPEGVMFAILIMNAFTPLIDRILPAKPIGGIPDGK
ncbi:Nitrogen fixation protein RnfD [Sedimentisphaera cyanobacteriorum]|uniref:Ion-translocating oxidoreductase complex subunit D n=1 Tax=Sedimentisphaera cyanobacteriorum TaxID=1940790 RepID=A0A1Q2HNZ3_9BACT|nr:RnfABCDGE type electron transport complex subunit D [Sedimentisphaera cyanobacteriorum]AQQ08994.1 Nitrogen fixation protein RnfD [Sedimentisphaera cyanobacteriorum]